MTKHGYPPQKEQECLNCRYYFNGDCHRYAPRPELGEQTLAAYWPFDMERDWCGEWAPQEVSE